jgi:hypothetical protein
MMPSSLLLRPHMTQLYHLLAEKIMTNECGAMVKLWLIREHQKCPRKVSGALLYSPQISYITLGLKLVRLSVYVHV